MNETLRDLAAGASAYLKELRDRDVPYELAEILVRDWHAVRLQALYGVTIREVRNQNTMSETEAAQLADLVIKKIAAKMALRSKA